MAGHITITMSDELYKIIHEMAVREDRMDDQQALHLLKRVLNEPVAKPCPLPHVRELELTKT